jgi:cell division septation protein DedD
MAVLVLAGCGEGTRVEHKAAPSAAPAVQPPATAAVPQWDVEVKGGTVQAVSDLTGWLIEHGFISYVSAVGGKERILIGPFSSKAEAETRQAQLTASLERAKKQNVESVVVEHNAAQ